MTAEHGRPSFDGFMGQSEHIKRLREDFSRSTYVHAYLFTGPKGTGKRSVAQLCAMTAVCRGETKPCGLCGPCRRILAGSHPDYHEVTPPKDKKTISVERIRSLIEEVGVKSFEDGVKAILLPEAEKLTIAAQNCLLKTLEEPPEKTVFFFVTDQPSGLLPTIVSRCRVLRFHPLSVQDCAKRLKALGQDEKTCMQRARIAEGCVGRALEIDEAHMQMRKAVTQEIFGVHRAGDVPGVSARYKEDREKQKQVLDILECAVRDIVIAQAGGSPLEGAGYAPEAERYAQAVPLSGGLALSAAITRARMMLASNVGAIAVLESILLNISEDYRKWPW